VRFKPTISFCISRLETFLGNIAPRLLLNFRRLIGYGNEPELALLSQLCNKNLISLDIGANAGMYTYHMLKYSRLVHAFEPNPRYIKRLLGCFPRNVTVHPVALSNTAGESELRIPMAINGAGTLEKTNDFGGGYNGSEIEIIKVKMQPLDELGFKNVGLIKIDVEGYENTVLEGANKTISENIPVLIIEIEERHRRGSLAQVQDFLSKYGYKGYFLNNGQMKSMQHFDVEKLQSPENMKSIYINNFVFLTSTQLDKFVKSCPQKCRDITRL
jgi:FkbM family methyltransferase